MYQSEKGLLALLFDFSFSDFVTKKLIKFFYMAGMAGAVVVVLSAVISGFAQGAGAGFAALIFAPIVALILIALVRMQLEIVMVLFRISDYARTVAEAHNSNQSNN